MSENSVRVSEKKFEAAKDDKTSQIRTSDYSQPVNPSIDRILFLLRTIGNQAVGRLIKSGALQAKLKIGQSRDERVAEQVMVTPVYPAVQRQGMKALGNYLKAEAKATYSYDAGKQQTVALFNTKSGASPKYPDSRWFSAGTR
jgi:hypothetical protein